MESTASPEKLKKGEEFDSGIFSSIVGKTMDYFTNNRLVMESDTLQCNPAADFLL